MAEFQRAAVEAVANLPPEQVSALRALQTTRQAAQAGEFDWFQEWEPYCPSSAPTFQRIAFRHTPYLDRALYITNWIQYFRRTMRTTGVCGSTWRVS